MYMYIQQVLIHFHIYFACMYMYVDGLVQTYSIVSGNSSDRILFVHTIVHMHDPQLVCRQF